MNIVIISGNLTREPEVRETAKGSTQLRLGLAVNERRKNAQTGEWEDVPQYVDCVWFGTRAANVAKFLHKGQKVLVRGKLSYSSWEDKNGGGKRSKLEVMIDDLELPPRSAESAGHDAHVEAKANAYQPQQPDAYDDEDIPF